MSSNTIILRSIISEPSIRLGRLTLNADSPSQDFFDPPTTPTPSVDYHLNFTENIARNSSRGLRSRIIALLAASVSNISETSVEAQKSATHSLKNSREYFKAACASPEVRKWLQFAFEDNEDVFLVVGYQTVYDAVVREKVRSGMQGNVGESALAEAAVDRAYARERSYDVPGESVYAVQYRKIVFRWWDSRKLQNARLEKNNRWKVSPGVRGAEVYDDEDVMAECGEDGAIDADLGDDSDMEDELEGLDTWDEELGVKGAEKDDEKNVIEEDEELGVKGAEEDVEENVIEEDEEDCVIEADLGDDSYMEYELEGLDTWDGELL
ncbi:hypothetical protein EDC01DRAFT_451634 [Geopyxis carbonaria]|nr:hypothetical protein EDC01DRAFT_451634 [Geopyxis carbonaria]